MATSGDLYEYANKLFPGADILSVEVKDTFSSDHGHRASVKVWMHWGPPANTTRLPQSLDVDITCKSVDEAKTLLLAEAARREVLRRGGMQP